MQKKVRVAYFVSHPIQYQAPLLRRIAQEEDIELRVFFASDFSVKGYRDEGFGVEVCWDVALLDGYGYEFLPQLRDQRKTGFASLINCGIWSRLGWGWKAERYDVVWIHGYWSVNALQGIVAAKALGVPVLLRAETTLIDRTRPRWKLAIRRIFFRVLRHMVDGVLSIGSLNRENWQHYLGADFPEYFVPYAVDNEFFQQRSHEAVEGREQLRDELGLDAGRPVILFASKLTERKRCMDLLEAYIVLVGSAALASVPYLVIVGDGEERRALEARAAASGLSGIRFCGFKNQSELPRYFDLASVFVLPSRHEPWGLIVNEVMNAGRAVIVSDGVGCQPDLIRDGVEGCVFPAGDVAALSHALQRVLGSAETASAMGERALKRIAGWDFEEDVRGLRRAIAAVTKKLEA